jgi:hypothetical protein
MFLKKYLPGNNPAVEKDRGPRVGGIRLFRKDTPGIIFANTS